MEHVRKGQLLPAIITLVMLMLACNMPGLASEPAAQLSVTLTPQPSAQTPEPPTEEPAATLEGADADGPVRPSSASGSLLVVTDWDNRDTAEQKTASGGDGYIDGRLERPFTDGSMEYLPWLDISSAQMVQGAPFFYFGITLRGSPDAYDGDVPVYGFELDTDLDGRGDFLMLTWAPFGTEWGQERVQAWEDTDESVGGPTPILSDPPGNPGDGYDQLVFMFGLGENPSLLWARLDPYDPNRLEMALHVDLLEGVSDFTWGAFADGFYRAPDGFDLNDRWTLAEAGSALKGEHYPLKTFHSFDNTCRGAFGDVDDDVPGLCAPDELSSQEATPAPQSGQGVAPPVIVVTVNPVIELPEPPPAPFPGIRTVIATLIPDVVEPYLPPY